MLGNPGSNPLELFWDAVDVLDQQLDGKIAILEAAIARHRPNKPVEHDGNAQTEGKEEEQAKGFVVGPETTEEEFKNIVNANADDAVHALSSGDMRTVYRTVSCFRSEFVPVVDFSILPAA